MSLALLIANAADTLTFLGLAGQITEANPLVAALPVPLALALRWGAVGALALAGHYLSRKRRIVLLGAGVVIGMVGYCSNVASLPEPYVQEVAPWAGPTLSPASRYVDHMLSDGPR